MKNNTLDKLAKVLDERKKADPEKSYVAGLYTAGTNTILKKIGEETAELVIAAKDNDKSAILHESADLLFHLLVMLAHCGLGPDDVLAELDRRFGQSGIDEKTSRNKT